MDAAGTAMLAGSGCSSRRRLGCDEASPLYQAWATVDPWGDGSHAACLGSLHPFPRNQRLSLRPPALTPLYRARAVGSWGTPPQSLGRWSRRLCGRLGSESAVIPGRRTERQLRAWVPFVLPGVLMEGHISNKIKYELFHISEEVSRFAQPLMRIAVIQEIMVYRAVKLSKYDGILIVVRKIQFSKVYF
ncbi:hypothetical protein NDU88_001890 [Pleurodeles waltl]|uniref:Uncharacterized protein n=1 Tax=Pleurodeles waltl TaxID=8319 RepID=A0AAV7SCU5_PLEWA|nr:hypothetical protein NDU88_001890 [Pleurodeles waltl]